MASGHAPAHATIHRIDKGHANAKRRWEEMGSPEYLNGTVVAELNAASLCEPEPHPFDFRVGLVSFEVTLPPLSVASIAFR